MTNSKTSVGNYEQHLFTQVYLNKAPQEIVNMPYDNQFELIQNAMARFLDTGVPMYLDEIQDFLADWDYKFTEG